MTKSKSNASDPETKKETSTQRGGSIQDDRAKDAGNEQNDELFGEQKKGEAVAEKKSQ